MLQIIIWMLAMYMVLKGLEILWIGAASHGPLHDRLANFGIVILVVCILAAWFFVGLAELQVAPAREAPPEIREIFG